MKGLLKAFKGKKGEKGDPDFDDKDDVATIGGSGSAPDTATPTPAPISPPKESSRPSRRDGSIVPSRSSRRGTISIVDSDRDLSDSDWHSSSSTVTSSRRAGRVSSGVLQPRGEESFKPLRQVTSGVLLPREEEDEEEFVPTLMKQKRMDEQKWEDEEKAQAEANASESESERRLPLPRGGARRSVRGRDRAEGPPVSLLKDKSLSRNDTSGSYVSDVYSESEQDGGGELRSRSSRRPPGPPGPGALAKSRSVQDRVRGQASGDEGPSGSASRALPRSSSSASARAAQQILQAREATAMGRASGPSARRAGDRERKGQWHDDEEGEMSDASISRGSERRGRRASTSEIDDDEPPPPPRRRDGRRSVERGAPPIRGLSAGDDERGGQPDSLRDDPPKAPSRSRDRGLTRLDSNNSEASAYQSASQWDNDDDLKSGDEAGAGMAPSRRRRSGAPASSSSVKSGQQHLAGPDSIRKSSDRVSGRPDRDEREGRDDRDEVQPVSEPPSRESRSSRYPKGYVGSGQLKATNVIDFSDRSSHRSQRSRRPSSKLIDSDRSQDGHWEDERDGGSDPEVDSGGEGEARRAEVDGDGPPRRRMSGTDAAAALRGHQHHGELRGEKSWVPGTAGKEGGVPGSRSRGSRRSSAPSDNEQDEEPPPIRRASRRAEESGGEDVPPPPGVRQSAHQMARSGSGMLAPRAFDQSEWGGSSRKGSGRDSAAEEDGNVREDVKSGSGARIRLQRRKSSVDRRGGEEEGEDAGAGAGTGKSGLGRSASSKMVSEGVNVLRRPLTDLRDKYAINSSEELGRGRFGVIRVCVSRTTGERLACKTISKGRLQRWQDLEDIRTEVQVMEMMKNYPHVVQLKDAFEDATHVHLVMELCEGGELFDRIKAKRRYSEGKAATVIRTIVTVLRNCHALNIMHRDLKPENILLVNKDDDTVVKVIDFGVAVIFRPGQPITEVVGTPNYLAPEVLEGKYGPECDVWSAGIVLYILLSGSPPFWAINQNDGTLELMKSKPLDLSQNVWNSISPPAKNLVRRMLVIDPAARIKPDEILAHPWVTS